MNSIFVQLGERDRMAPPRTIEKLSTLAPHASGLMSVRDDFALADTRPVHRQSISLNDRQSISLNDMTALFRDPRAAVAEIEGLGTPAADELQVSSAMPPRSSSVR
jgi:hypothetical protein